MDTLHQTTEYTPSPLFDSLDQFKSIATLPPQLQTATSAIQQDFQLSYHFLYSYRGSAATFNSYRREIERFLHWSWFICHKSLAEVKREDIEQFIHFCQNPPRHWIGHNHKPRFIEKAGLRLANPDWRPFVNQKQTTYLMPQKTTQAIFAILGSFFAFLIQEDHVTNNPVLQIRQKSKFIRKQQNSAIIRRLSELQWGYVIETAQQLAEQKPELHERTLFIMQALYSMYLRISELASSARWEPQMGHFQRDHDGNWWFTTVGKGNKQRQIAVSDAMLAALKRYRQSLQLPALPGQGETHPLIMNHRNGRAITSTRQIRDIVQFCFDRSHERLLADGFQEEAAQLLNATVHWLRHTGISEDVKHRPREHVRDDAGHSSSAITDKYIDVELRARHASSKRKRIIPDFLEKESNDYGKN